MEDSNTIDNSNSTHTDDIGDVTDNIGDTDHINWRQKWHF